MHRKFHSASKGQFAQRGGALLSGLPHRLGNTVQHLFEHAFQNFFQRLPTNIPLVKRPQSQFSALSPCMQHVNISKNPVALR